MRSRQNALQQLPLQDDSALADEGAPKAKRVRKRVGKKVEQAQPAPRDADVIDLAVKRQRALVKQLLDAARNTAAARALLPEALGEAEEFPDDPTTRCYILQMRERAGESEGISAAWEALFREQPDDRIILQFHMRRLVRDKQQDKALALLEERIPTPGRNYTECLTRAELLDTIQAFDVSDAAFAYAVERYDKREARISWAKRLIKRGRFEDAGLLLEPLVGSLSAGSKAEELAEKIAVMRGLFRNYEKQEDLAGVDFRLLAMKHAVLAHRERVVPERTDGPLRIVMVTGSLGAGGAERQLSTLARMMRKRADDPVHGIGRVEVLVKEHHPRRRGDFFLPDLLAAQVPVKQANDLQPIAPRKQFTLDEDLMRMLDNLPSQVHYGVVRMTPLFREMRPDVVSLWQDGACLYGALAALLAGVPRIQLVFRGLPPNIRSNRLKPEYEVLFKALAHIPGVEFMSNSHAAAKAYAEWLGLPEDRITVLWNAVPALARDGAPEDRETWERFAAETCDAEETIGGVFRFEPDKRPLVWIRMAAQYLRQRPKARFVIVGAGQLMDEARALAEAQGLGGRLLFAGTSNAVGYWYEKMDVKVLLSRFEGLPNVLIEAQQFGTPVVSTPAGGAAECFVEGESGHILDCAANPSLDLACEKIGALVDRRRLDNGLSHAARLMAQQFDVDTILDRFVALCRDGATVTERAA